MDLSPTLGPNCSFTGAIATTHWGSRRVSSDSSRLVAGRAVEPQHQKSLRSDSSPEHIVKLRIPVFANRPQNRSVFIQNLDFAFPCAGTAEAISQPWEMYG